MLPSTETHSWASQFCGYGREGHGRHCGHGVLSEPCPGADPYGAEWVAQARKLRHSAPSRSWRGDSRLESRSQRLNAQTFPTPRGRLPPQREGPAPGCHTARGREPTLRLSGRPSVGRPWGTWRGAARNPRQVVATARKSGITVASFPPLLGLHGSRTDLILVLTARAAIQVHTKLL